MTTHGQKSKCFYFQRQLITPLEWKGSVKNTLEVKGGNGYAMVPVFTGRGNNSGQVYYRGKVIRGSGQGKCYLKFLPGGWCRHYRTSALDPDVQYIWRGQVRPADSCPHYRKPIPQGDFSQDEPYNDDDDDEDLLHGAGGDTYHINTRVAVSDRSVYFMGHIVEEATPDKFQDRGGGWGRNAGDYKVFFRGVKAGNAGSQFEVRQQL